MYINMNILITRPSPYGEKLVNKLLDMGIFAYHLPLIYFSTGKNLLLLKKQLNFLSEGDFLFLISQHAISYAHNQLIDVGVSWPTKLIYYSIGKTTSIKMRNLSGISVKYPKDQETSEGLLKLPELINIDAGRRALILKGNNGRDFLEDTLQKRGVYVTCCECYNRHFLQYSGIEQCHYMLFLKIRIVVITSESMLMHLYYLIPKYYRISWLIQCRLIVVSPRLATRAKQLGWEDIIVAWSANNETLIQVLMKYT